MKPACCAICGLSDARALTEIRLAARTKAVVCGSHALVHERAPAVRTLAQLREIARDRRERDRRGDAADLSADALSAGLAEAFARGRRAGADRRAS